MTSAKTAHNTIRGRVSRPNGSHENGGNDALVAIHHVRNAAKSPKNGWARLRTRLPL